MKENGDWFSDRTKSWIVAITMTILLGGMIGGYWKMKSWSNEQHELRQKAEQTEQLERLIEDDD